MRCLLVQAEATGGVPVTVYYGSQTGTAADYSSKIKSEGKPLGFSITVVDLDDFESVRRFSRFVRSWAARYPAIHIMSQVVVARTG